ncbi:ATP-binding protein [Pseudomonas sichuanensis]|uniref:ATP-binding protein n=1 Tax=Pseudomonas sichuanensis TaxID=2213015 RepID=UPI002ABBA0CA|nr:ATP-binding protein [Pseudomonas sichuanensis]MDZ4019112.1 Transposon Tn7 transposition protein TnsC [Pseudomonas sichuanensis]
MSSRSFADATYHSTGMPQYDGNPLIECLPAILDDLDVVRGVGNLPAKPDSTELQLSPKLRGHGVNRLKELVVPFDIHLDLEDGFSQLLRYGYTARNPFTPETVRYRTPYGVTSGGFKSSASTLTLIGLSGMGKTTALDSITKLYPQVVRHSYYNDRIFIETQVVWLKIECPHDGSLRGFCAAFLSALDHALGIDDYSSLMLKRSSVSVLLQSISQLCRTYFIGALIIDEMQHLSNSRGGRDRDKLLNFFVTLSNDTGVPLVYVGTNAMLPLFSGVLRNARRAVGMGEVTFDRFEEDDPFWDHLVDQAWSYDWTGCGTTLDESMRRTIYDLSQGNTDFLIKLLMLVQQHALSEGLKSITPQTLRHVYDRQMKILHKPIEALRSRDPQQVADFEDMMPTKDQVARMLYYDLSRRAESADRARIRQLTAPLLTQPQAVPPSKPISVVKPHSLEDVHLAEDTEVQSELLRRGWIDEDPNW